METVVLNGVVAGEGDGLVLLHPIGLDHSFWGGLPARLARHRRVLALDLRGFGGSPPGPGRMPIAAYAADVRAAMVQHGMERADVVGLSFGGLIAQTLALDFPHAVSRLVLCGCTAGIPPEARNVLRERGLAAERGGMEAVVPATIARWFTAGFADEPVVERVRARLRSDSVAAWSDGWHAIAEFDARPRLGRLEVPTLVVAGEVDAANTAAAAQALADAIPGARLVTLPGAPHMMQLEAEEAFADAVESFLAEPQPR